MGSLRVVSTFPLHQELSEWAEVPTSRCAAPTPSPRKPPNPRPVTHGATTDEYQTLMDTSKSKAVCVSSPLWWWQPLNPLTLWGVSSRPVVSQRTGGPPHTGRCREAAGSEPVDETRDTGDGKQQDCERSRVSTGPQSTGDHAVASSSAPRWCPVHRSAEPDWGQLLQAHTGARSRQPPVTPTALPQLQLETEGE